MAKKKTTRPKQTAAGNNRKPNFAYTDVPGALRNILKESQTGRCRT